MYVCIYTCVCLYMCVGSYNLMKLGIRKVEDAIDDQGHFLSFLEASRKYTLGMHHRFI